MIRSSLLTYFALSLLLGQVNLPLFTHVCHGMGMTWTSVAKPPKACCGKKKKNLQEHHKVSSEAKSCDTIAKSPCCEDHIKYASLSVQFVQQAIKVFAHTNWVSFTFQTLEESLFLPTPPSADAIVHVHGPPGKLSGRALLIAHQLFLC
ncbi:MAG TPA: hypothetical protein VGK46_11135 [Saprospiraceae bacterium]